MKISQAQEKVIELMQQGWLIHWYGGLTVGCVLQKGGETKQVTSGSVMALRTLDLITELPRFEHQLYNLTRYGLKS